MTNFLFGDNTKEYDVINQLKQYDNLYYNDGDSVIDDEEYDSLKDYAKNLYPENSYFKEVGAKVLDRKVKLKYVLGSLKKVKIDTVESWMEKTGSDIFVITEKLDGASIEVDYDNGEVVFAATRGDGYYGQDITNKAKIFCPKIERKGSLHFRAEAMLTWDIHKQLGFKTKRNGVVGILNRDGIKNADKIVPFFYDMMNYVGTDEDEKMQFICDVFEGKKAGVVKGYIHHAEENTIKEMVDFLESAKDCEMYDVDGLVICPVNYERENVEYPENKVAFKVNEKPVETEVVKVEWRVGRTGRVVPLVWVKPIEIQGVTIQKATGFNYKFIMDNQLGKGSVVSIVRSGDVIPYIVNCWKKGMSPLIAHKCPSCEKGLLPVGVDLVCHNPNCDAKTLKRIEHFLIRMGAENITRKTLKKLKIKDIEELYYLDEVALLSYPGFGVKRVEQICNEIDKTLTTTPDKFISALGIPLVGRSVSKLIVEYLKPLCENEEHIMDKAFMMKPDELVKIDGIGEVIANMFFKNIRRYGEGLLGFLYNQGLRWESQKAGVDFSGLQFTLTGKGPMSRNAIKNMITSRGGVEKGISKKTNYLVTANVDSNTSKAKKAREYGIEIISYEQLMEMMGE